MKGKEATLFGEWCRETNSIIKSRTIKYAFDEMLERHLNSVISDTDYIGYKMLKKELTECFNNGYYRLEE